MINICIECTAIVSCSHKLASVFVDWLERERKQEWQQRASEWNCSNKTSARARSLSWFVDTRSKSGYLHWDEPRCLLQSHFYALKYFNCLWGREMNKTYEPTILKQIDCCLLFTVCQHHSFANPGSDDDHDVLKGDLCIIACWLQGSSNLP